MTIQPGTVLNPLGRGARKPLTDAVRAAICNPEFDKVKLKDCRTPIQRAAWHIANGISNGELNFIRECFDRTEGKAPQPIVGDNDYDAVKSETEISPVGIEILKRHLAKLEGK